MAQAWDAVFPTRRSRIPQHPATQEPAAGTRAPPGAQPRPRAPPAREPQSCAAALPAAATRPTRGAGLPAARAPAHRRPANLTPPRHPGGRRATLAMAIPGAAPMPAASRRPPLPQRWRRRGLRSAGARSHPQRSGAERQGGACPVRASSPGLLGSAAGRGSGPARGGGARAGGRLLSPRGPATGPRAQLYPAGARPARPCCSLGRRGVGPGFPHVGLGTRPGTVTPDLPRAGPPCGLGARAGSSPAARGASGAGRPPEASERRAWDSILLLCDYLEVLSFL